MSGQTGSIVFDPNQKAVAMLRILLASALTTRDALDAADNPVDRDFRDDLDRIIERTEAELAAFAKGSQRLDLGAARAKRAG